jgi:hypothetical protein
VRRREEGEGTKVYTVKDDKEKMGEEKKIRILDMVEKKRDNTKGKRRTK